MSNAKEEIRARVEAFASELSDLVRQVTLGNVVEALKNAEVPPPARRPGRPPKIASAHEEQKITGRKPGGPAKATTAPPSRRPYRAPELLAQLMERVRRHIRANPGQGISPIATSLGASKEDLKRPLRKLLDEMRITSRGRKRSTRYFPK